MAVKGTRQYSRNLVDSFVSVTYTYFLGSSDDPVVETRKYGPEFRPTFVLCLNMAMNQINGRLPATYLCPPFP